MDKTERERTTQKLLLAMDKFLGVAMFTKFLWTMAINIPLQPNGYDCGIFVIKYMQQSDNFVRQNPSFQFDSNKERLDLALEFLNSDLNQEKKTLYDKVARRCKQGKTAIERKWVDTCKTLSEDVGRGACMELVASDNRVKRKNASLEKGCVKGYELPTIELVGKKFQSYAKQIWKWLMENKVSTIGIWGMGGAGKTTLATHVHNKLLKEAGDDFDYVIWVTASRYDTIYELQKVIARSINLDISDEHDVKRISGKLVQASKHLNRCVLLLDDVWDPIFLEEEVGFPVSNNGIKLILTTRSWEVCQTMNCLKSVIEVEPLNEEDGWELFKTTLGSHMMQSSEVEPIASTVAKQCEGLPLAIVTIARSMKGKEGKREWSHLLECLQNLDKGQSDMEERVFPVLKSSYACLNNKLQRFFLYLALTGKECFVDSNFRCLIRRFFHEEWIDEKKSLEMQYNEGYTMMKKLKNGSLLMEIYDGEFWIMPKLLRVMAINIVKKTDEIMDKSDMNLTEIPENGEWHENLQKVFLSRNEIQKIVDGTSLRCSKLSTLRLDCNYDLKWIPDDFFNNMPLLKYWICLGLASSVCPNPSLTCRMRILLTWALLSHLLEGISVISCKSMEEIVGEDCSNDNILPTITLPKLRFVYLYKLPELNSVFRGTMLCPSLKSFHAVFCEKLSHPSIEIEEGHELLMKNTKTGYCWSSDDQELKNMVEKDREKENEDDEEEKKEEEEEEEEEDEDGDEEEEEDEDGDGEEEEDEDEDGEEDIKLWLKATGSN
ncbi:disease resistance protein RPS5-like isoform X2 [Prosopis cineraria]|uniref:disease resistance protein RPS5-like isoform X2 n=1 Tax=Prosopis cineraria TaxID=364024 RepID=UPI00240FBDEB|nr:disease resistance protein RPS5-like isoform X2 [Prosopis cineraria]